MTRVRIHVRVDRPDEMARPRWDSPHMEELNLLFGDELHLALSREAAHAHCAMLQAVCLIEDQDRSPGKGKR